MMKDSYFKSGHPFLRSRRILAAGGTRITHSNVKFCKCLGGLLMQESNLVLVTGGLLGDRNSMGLCAADWYFVEGARETLARINRSEDKCIETVLPEQDNPDLERFRVGKTVILKKKTPQARRFAVVNSADVVLTVEGGKATRQQIELAFAIDKPILPLPFTMGTSREAWEQSREEIKILFDIEESIAGSWETVSLQNLPPEKLNLLAISVKDRLMHRLKRRCFILMPFDDEFLPLYHNVIQPAVIDAGLTPVRSDHLNLIGNALKLLRDLIDSCECAVAVTTGWNPNVMYELGLVHAGGKSVVILHETEENKKLPKIPFDLTTEFIYGYQRNRFEELKRDLIHLLRSNIER